ncbi:Fe-S cluster assembly protein SufD [Ignavigranum ruoffiae]
MTTEEYHFMNYQYRSLPDWFYQAYQMTNSWLNLDSKFLQQIPYQDWFNYQPIDQERPETTLTYAPEAAIVEERFAAQMVQTAQGSLLESMNQVAHDQGLIVMDLFEALEKYPDLVQPHLFSLIDPQEDKVAAYNLNQLDGGIFVYVPDYQVIDQPIELTWLQDNQADFPFNQRLLVILGQESQLTLIERTESIGQENNSATIMAELIVGQGAQLDYVIFDRLGKESSNYIRRYLKTDRDARIQVNAAAMNDGDSVLDLQAELKGTGSQCQLASITVGDGQQRQGINAKIINQAPHTIGNIIQHGVALEASTVTFNGIGHIIKAAKQADSQQESRIMMLSDQAKGDANPILLIDEYEVQAGHAASIGRVDAEQLYYLMSRGLNRRQAEYLVIRGFLGQVFANIEDTDLRKQLLESLDHKLSSYQVMS